jgi:hypothetical protein
MFRLVSLPPLMNENPSLPFFGWCCCDAAEREPFAAAVSLGAAATVQEASTASVSLGVAALEDMGMVMEPMHGGLEETTKGLEAVKDIEEHEPAINLIDEDAMVIDLLCLFDESDDEMSDDGVDILDNLCN